MCDGRQQDELWAARSMYAPIVTKSTLIQSPLPTCPRLQSGPPAKPAERTKVVLVRPLAPVLNPQPHLKEVSHCPNPSIGRIQSRNPARADTDFSSSLPFWPSCLRQPHRLSYWSTCSGSLPRLCPVFWKTFGLEWSIFALLPWPRSPSSSESFPPSTRPHRRPAEHHTIFLAAMRSSFRLRPRCALPQPQSPF